MRLLILGGTAWLGGEIARTALAVIAILLLAAAVAAIVTLSTTSSSDRVNLEEVVKDNLQEQVDSLRDVIEDNTE